MARAFSLVLIPVSTPFDEINNAVSKLLDPHAIYNDSFEPYRHPCDECCWFSSDDGIKAANEQISDFHVLWHAFQSMPEAERPEWSKYMEEWEQKAIGAALSSPNYEDPNPNCYNCNGTGIVTSKIPVSGIRYDYRVMNPDEWSNLGLTQDFAERPESYDSIVTPDGQAHLRNWDQSAGIEEWEARTRKICDTHEDYIVIKVHMHV